MVDSNETPDMLDLSSMGGPALTLLDGEEVLERLEGNTGLFDSHCRLWLTTYRVIFCARQLFRGTFVSLYVDQIDGVLIRQRTLRIFASHPVAVITLRFRHLPEQFINALAHARRHNTQSPIAVKASHSLPAK